MSPSTPRDAVTLSPNAVTVLEKRYLIKDDAGKPVETPSDLFWRVARTIADLEGDDALAPKHLSEALKYRTLDRNLWVSPGGPRFDPHILRKEDLRRLLKCGA